jgi:hypothetical protein
MSDLSNDTKKHTTKSREAIPLNYHQKHTENDILMKTSETTKFVQIFCEEFLNFKKYFA